MFAAASAFTSPLGPLHFADPSTSTSTSLASFFSGDSSSKRFSCPTKRDKPCPSSSSKATKISSLVLLSSFNPLVASSATSSSSEPALRAPAPPYAAEEGRLSPPPAYDPLRPSPSSTVSFKNGFNRKVDQTLIDAHLVESRFVAWDAEYQIRINEELREVDGRVAEEVRRLGL